MKKYLAVSILLMASGCISIGTRCENFRQSKPYVATCVNCNMLEAPFTDNGLWGKMCSLFYIGIVIDLPFNVVIDTVCMPFDFADGARLEKPFSEQLQPLTEGREK